MKVSKDWLKELVEIKDMLQVETLLPLRTISTKDVTSDYIELDMKGYNRADLLSMRGVAYEVAAILDSEVTFTEPEVKDYIWTQLAEKADLKKLHVVLENPQLVPMYCVVKIEGLKVGPSEKEWVKKLADCGVRSINNVADITNLVMLEYGQPLHAFDASEVTEETIYVRNAKKGEKLETLDGKNRELSEEDLLIADPEKALGIAGVMGGKNSEITDQTSTILLEAAIFDPISLRRTSQRLGLTSEASKRFYHGLTKKRLLQALDAAIRRYQDLGGTVTGLTISGGLEDTPKETYLTLTKTQDLIGVKVTRDEVEKFLEKLHFQLKETTEEKDYIKWQVGAPYWRLDIDIQEDLIEEVARMYGYEKIPPQPLPGTPPAKIDQKLFELVSSLKETLAAEGLTEAQTYSFYTTKVLQALGFNEENKAILVKVANPISSETEYLRMNLWPNLVEFIDKNLRRGAEDIAIFEVGKIFPPNPDNKLEEKFAFSIALMNGTDNPLSELYQIFQKVNKKLSLKIEDKPNEQTDPLGLFHSKRFIRLSLDGKPVGGMAEVHPRVLDQYGIKNRVAILEIDLSKLL